MTRPSFALRFPPTTPDPVRRRITYAFGLFAFTHGYSVDDHSDRSVGWGTATEADVCLPRVSFDRPLDRPAPSPTWVNGLPTFHGVDRGAPDLLAELFEWAARPHELAVGERDDVGRLPTASTLPVHAGLDHRRPWANLLMAALNDRLRARWPDLPERPAAFGSRTAVVASHDIDFLAGRAHQTAIRYTKNLALAGAVRRDPAVVRSALRGGPKALDRLAWVAEEERRRGLDASWYVLCRSANARDANYDLAEGRTGRALGRLAGAEVGVHGSYTSLEAPGRLAEEYQRLRSRGFDPVGGRQHWLRYDDNTLFRELVRAGARYDATVGYSDDVGFRQGLASPFPVYDLGTDRVLPVIELPLVLMDVGVDHLRRTGEDWRAAVDQVVAGVAEAAVGGPSIVWHDTVFGGTQVHPAVADAYWTTCEGAGVVAATEVLAEAEARLDAAFPLNLRAAAPSGSGTGS